MNAILQIDGKTCPRCEHDRPWSAFYRNKNRRDGHDNMCKKCRNAYNKARRESPKGDEDRARRRKWRARPENRSNENARTQAWKEANRTHVAAYNAEYFQANQEHLQEIHKRRAETSPERFRKYAREDYARHREKRKEAVAAYRQTPRGKAVKARAAHKRRTHSYDAGPMPSIEELIKLKDETTHCRYCKREMTEKHLAPTEKTLDHKIPISREGSNDLSNLECICRRCNTRKSASTSDEFEARLAVEGA